MAEDRLQECREIDFGVVNEILNGGLESSEKCSMITNGVLQTMSNPITVELVPENERPSLYMRKHQADLNVLKGLREILELDEEIPSIRCIVSIFENPRLFSDIIDACDEAFPERFEINGAELSQSNVHNAEYIAVSEDYIVQEEDDLDVLSEDEYLVEDTSDSRFPRAAISDNSVEQFVSDIFSGVPDNASSNYDHIRNSVFSTQAGSSPKPSPPNSRRTSDQDESDSFAEALLESTTCSIKFGHLKLNIGKWKQVHNELDEECNAFTSKNEVFCNLNFKPIDAVPITPSVFDLINMSNYLSQAEFCDECVTNRRDTTVLGCDKVEVTNEAVSRSYLKLSKVSKKFRERTVVHNDLKVASLTENNKNLENMVMRSEVASFQVTSVIDKRSDTNVLSLNSKRETTVEISSPELMEESIDSGVFIRFTKNVHEPFRILEECSNTVKSENCNEVESNPVSKDVVSSKNDFPKVSEEESQNLVKRICAILDKMAVPPIASDVKSNENCFVPSNSNDTKSDLHNFYSEPNKDLDLVSDLCPEAPIIGPGELGSYNDITEIKSPKAMDSHTKKGNAFTTILDEAENLIRNPDEKMLLLFKKQLKKNLKKLKKKKNGKIKSKELKALTNTHKNKKKKKLMKKFIHFGKEDKSGRKVFIKDLELNESVGKNGFKENSREEDKGRNEDRIIRLGSKSLKNNCSNESVIDGINSKKPVVSVQQKSKDLPAKKIIDDALSDISSGNELPSSIPTMLSIDMVCGQHSKHSETAELASNASAITSKVSKSQLILTNLSDIIVNSCKESEQENVSQSNVQRVKRSKTEIVSIPKRKIDSESSKNSIINSNRPQITPISFKLKQKQKPKTIICAKEFESINTDPSDNSTQFQESSSNSSGKSLQICSKPLPEPIPKLADDSLEKNSASPSRANTSSNETIPHPKVKTTVTNGYEDSKEHSGRDRLALTMEQVKNVNSNLLPPRAEKPKSAGSNHKQISKKSLSNEDSSAEQKKYTKSESSIEKVVFISDDEDSGENISKRRDKFSSKGRLHLRKTSPVIRRKWHSRSKSRSRTPVRRRRSRSISPRYRRREGYSSKKMLKRSPSPRRYQSPPRYRSPSPHRRASSPRSRRPSPRSKRKSPLFKCNSDTWTVKPASISIQLTEASRTVYETNYSHYPLAQQYSGCQTTASYQLPVQYSQYYDPSLYQTDPTYNYQPPPHPGGSY